MLVPLIGIMFGNVVMGVTGFLAHRFDMTQAMASWSVGHFSMVMQGRYELVWLAVPLIALAFVFARHFNIVGMGRDFSRGLGLSYERILFMGLSIAAMITAAVVTVVGSISYIGHRATRTPARVCEKANCSRSAVWDRTSCRAGLARSAPAGSTPAGAFQRQSV